MATGAPSAWAVWNAWHGSAGQVAGIARQVEKHVGAPVSVELDAGDGTQNVEPDRLESDVAPRYWRSFRRLLIAGGTGGRRIEVEFDNERERTPGRGVVLRTWAEDAGDAAALRDALYVPIDGGRGLLADKPKKGPANGASADETLVKAERAYRIGLAAVGFGVAGIAIGAASLANRLVEPTSDIGRILFFCLCGAREVVVLIYLLLVATLAFVVAPTIFPPIEISERSRWQRVRGKVGALVVSSIGLGAVLEIIANGLPS